MIELARADLRVAVLDRRPPPGGDDVRPQLLVARAGDLANLEQLGVDVRDPTLVSPLTDGALEPAPAGDLWALVAQPRLALVPIGRLQEALYAMSLDRAGC